MKYHCIIPLALLALLSACGPPQPVYRTTFQMIPPSNETGKMCTSNCLLSQQNCQQSCTIQKQNCEQNNYLKEQNAKLQADRDYEDYVRDRTRDGKLIKKKRSDFVNYFGTSCDETICMEQCINNFHMCYSNCGGQIIPQTLCVDNCHLIVPTPLPMTPARPIKPIIR